MDIKELKEKYNISFIELEELTEFDRSFRIKNIEDIFSVTNIVFFYKEIIDENENSQENFRNLLDEFMDTELIPYSLRLKFINKAELMFSKLCKGNESSILYVFDPKNNCYWEETPERKEIIITEKHKSKLREVLKLVEDEDIKKSQEISTFIEGFKENYSNCKTKVAKESIIQEIQVKLKNKYGLDGRSDTIASKTGLRMILEN